VLLQASFCSSFLACLVCDYSMSGHPYPSLPHFAGKTDVLFWPSEQEVRALKQFERVWYDSLQDCI